MADAGTQADRAVVAFARVLRSAGLDVPVGATVTFAEALARVGVESRERVYWSARATLVRRPEDVRAFDAAFDTFWLGRGKVAVTGTPERVSLTLAHDAPDDGAAEDDDDTGDDVADERLLTVRWSRAEVLRHRDFA
ncbi:MAG TPA: hypothetical protein VFW74_13235, partial [Acidimicrobiia bacterium]|nr:hypothetical protein [Acidimicrobiia bacterium]